jgi:hypothetical protein
LTRQEALDKAAECLQEAETSINDSHLSKYINLAQLYMTLAHTVGSDVD